MIVSRPAGSVDVVNVATPLLAVKVAVPDRIPVPVNVSAPKGKEAVIVEKAAA